MPVPLRQEQTLRPTSDYRRADTLALDVSAFLADCQVRNLAQRTVAIYTRQLEALQAWAGRIETGALTTGDMRRYFLALQAKHNAGGQHQAFRVLRTFFRWLLAEGVIDANPMRTLRAPYVREEPLPPVPLPDVAAMLATCRGSGLLDVRDAALLLALLDSAARAHELLSCDVADLDTRTGALVLRITKNRKPRVTFLGARARKAMLRYIRARGALAPQAPLFATDAGERLTYSGLRQVLRRRAQRAGVKEPGAHAFRRAACLAMLRNGADVFSVQALAGHADLATTRRYLALLTEDLQAAHAAHSPVDRLLG